MGNGKDRGLELAEDRFSVFGERRGDDCGTAGALRQ